MAEAIAPALRKNAPIRAQIEGLLLGVTLEVISKIIS
jgi:hypothetical protein